MYLFIRFCLFPSSDQHLVDPSDNADQVFILQAEVWVCMELMATCFEKLSKRLKGPIPEPILGKLTVAVIRALDYLKEQHDIIHRGQQ